MKEETPEKKVKLYVVKLWSTSDLCRQCLRKSHRPSTTDNTATSSKVDIVIRRLVS